MILQIIGPKAENRWYVKAAFKIESYMDFGKNSSDTLKFWHLNNFPFEMQRGPEKSLLIRFYARTFQKMNIIVSTTAENELIIDILREKDILAQENNLIDVAYRIFRTIPPADWKLIRIVNEKFRANFENSANPQLDKPDEIFRLENKT